MSVLSSLFASSAATERRDWLSDDESMYSGSTTASGVRINQDRAMTQSTVWACVRLLTNTIATLPTDLVASIGRAKFTLDRPEERPSWLVNPDPSDPTMTSTEHFAQVAASLLLDGNFFTYAPLSVYDPSVLIVLDPRRVDVKSGANRRPFYDVRDDMGRLVQTVDAMHMLHGAWIKMPGTLRGLSPVEAARQGIGLGLTAEEFGGRFFGQGASMSFGVEVPGGLTDPQKQELRDALRKAHAGTRQSHNIGVLTGGAKFVTGLGITNEQAQFLELRKFQVEDIARWFGVPPHMVGSQEPGASSYNSVEQRSLEFREYAVLPLVRRIEDPYQRIVQAPDRLQGASIGFKFNLSALARADLKTRYESYGQGIQSGVLKPDEARALEDLPPVPGGDVTYMQSQMVPLGTPPAPPPAPPEPPDTSDEDEEEAADRALLRSAVAASLVPAAPSVVNVTLPATTISPPDVHVTTPEVRVDAPVTVNLPEQAIPPPAEIRVESPITVTVPEQPAPVVNLTAQIPDRFAVDIKSLPRAPRKVAKRRPGGDIEITEE